MSNKTLLYVGLGIAAYLLWQKSQAATAPAPIGPNLPSYLTQAQIDAMMPVIPQVVAAF